jgi:predicted enzyme related to lactoylglutathione lyase
MPKATDPLDVLRAPSTPLAPDPAFAADLRERLVRALLAPILKEPAMSIETTNRPRNGTRHGDVSYITLGVPDLARARVFYGAVLGWRFSPGSSDHGAQVEDIVPMMGLWDGEQAGGRVHGAVLGYRVEDIAAAVAAVRAHGGSVSDPHREPYAMAAEGHDNQNVPFYLHEMPSPVAGGPAPATGEFHNGEVEGDVSYLTMVVPDLDAAHAFYGPVLGWTFNVGSAGGAQVTGVAPQIGMTTQPEAGPATPGVILCYRVDDIEAAVARVRDAGGRTRGVAQRPYGLESLCADDQGTPFYLHQFPAG